MSAILERALGWAACTAAIVLLVVALIAGRAEAAPAVVSVTEAVVRLPAVAGRPAAGYFNLAGGLTLLSVSSPLASRIEMHSSSMAGGVMRMDRLAAVVVRPGETIRFAPGGKHLMIFGLSAALRPGAAVPLVFHLDDGKTIEAAARAVAAGGAVDMHGAH